MPRRERNCDLLVFSMCAVTFLSNNAFAIIAPFLPFLFQQKGIEVQIFGYIFAMYAVSFIICSPIVGTKINKYGKRIFIQVGLLTMGCSMIGFALISYIEHTGLFIVLALFFRILQGFSSASI